MTGTVLCLVAGLALLITGGDLLVRGAVRLAGRLGVSPLVIGLTLVGFGTSTPELVASVQAALVGAPGLAYGNIVGSNIANILLILGAAALLHPVSVPQPVLRRDGTMMLVATLAFAALAWAMPVTRLLGGALVCALVVYIVLTVRQERRRFAEDAATAERDPQAQGGLAGPALLALGGLAMVLTGGVLLVDGAVGLARALGWSETLIGLTVVAIGTSAPELITSVVAALRRQGDVAFGNVVGSNIYNILGIGGATALVAPGAIPADLLLGDVPVMVLAALALMIFAWTNRRISSGEGAGLLMAYALYLGWIWP